MKAGHHLASPLFQPIGAKVHSKILKAQERRFTDFGTRRERILKWLELADLENPEHVRLLDPTFRELIDLHKSRISIMKGLSMPVPQEVIAREEEALAKAENFYNAVRRVPDNRPRTTGWAGAAFNQPQPIRAAMRPKGRKPAGRTTIRRPDRPTGKSGHVEKEPTSDPRDAEREADGMLIPRMIEWGRRLFGGDAFPKTKALLAGKGFDFPQFREDDPVGMLWGLLRTSPTEFPPAERQKLAAALRELGGHLIKMMRAGSLTERERDSLPIEVDRKGAVKLRDIAIPTHFRTEIERLIAEDRSGPIIDKIAQRLPTHDAHPFVRGQEGGATQHELYGLGVQGGRSTRDPTERPAPFQPPVPLSKQVPLDGYLYNRWGPPIGEADRARMGRIFFAVRPDHAADFWRTLVETFEDLRGGSRYLTAKICEGEEVFQRGDSGVLYFLPEDQELIYERVVAIGLKHPDWFYTDRRPVLTAQLLDHQGNPVPGLSFGQEPVPPVSFGELRFDASAEALRFERFLKVLGVKSLNGSEPEIRLKLIAFELDRSGVDVGHPAFNRASEGRSPGIESFKFIFERTDQGRSRQPASGLPSRDQAGPRVDHETLRLLGRDIGLFQGRYLSGIDPALQAEFLAGAEVSHPSPGLYIKTTRNSTGPITGREFEEFTALSRAFGFPEGEFTFEDNAAFQALKGWGSQRGIQISAARPLRPQQAAYLLAALKALPEGVLANANLKEIRLGETEAGQKGSSFRDGRVYMAPETLDWPRPLFLGGLYHEIGHSIVNLLIDNMRRAGADPNSLGRAWEVISSSLTNSVF